MTKKTDNKHKKTTANTNSQQTFNFLSSPKIQKDQHVFLTAFLKKERSQFYVCKAIVEHVPDKNTRQIYKVRIVAVSDRPVGGSPVVKQAQLLGLTIVKSAKELHCELPIFMRPHNWIEKDSNDGKQGANK
jgi:hypothetical protein